MAKRNRAALKAFFETNDVPTEEQFGDLIDSILNSTDDAIVHFGEGLPADALGTDGDGYWDLTNKKIHRKASGSWDSGVSFEGPQGPQGETGTQGEAGSQGSAGQGVPTGGTAGQFLRKASATNYDSAWANPAISEVTNLDAVLTNKSDVGHQHTSDDFTDLQPLFLDATADAALITALGSASWTDDVATVAGWDQGRMHFAGGYLYVGTAADTVTRIENGAHAAGSAFDPAASLTRLISPTAEGATTTTGGDGDPYVTAAVESLASMVVSINGATPASNIGIKKLVANNYWEVIGSDNVEIAFTSDSAQGAADKGASPFTGPWFWYVVLEFAGTIGDDMIKMNAGGNKGAKLETISSKAVIKVNSTMLDWRDGTTTTAGVSLSFKNNWTVGQKYLIAMARMSGGINSAWLGTLSAGATPGKQLEHRTTGQVWIDDFDNIDPATFALKFKAGTKLYEIGYLAGEPSRDLLEALFNRGLTLVS